VASDEKRRPSNWGNTSGIAWFLRGKHGKLAHHSYVSPSLISLTNNRDALSAADARRGQTIPAAATGQFVEQSQDQTRSSRAQRMSQRNRAAVRISPFAIKSEFLLDREVLRREGFIHFDQIDVGKFQPRLVERQARCGAKSISASGTGVSPVIHAQDARATSKQDTTTINR
jgi:hypothetical protein